MQQMHDVEARFQNCHNNKRRNEKTKRLRRKKLCTRHISCSDCGRGQEYVDCHHTESEVESNDTESEVKSNDTEVYEDGRRKSAGLDKTMSQQTIWYWSDVTDDSTPDPCCRLLIFWSDHNA